jgi:hypothetical protein
MNGDRVFSIIAGLVTVTLVTTIVARPNSVKVIRELANGFTGAISASLGRGVSFG